MVTISKPVKKKARGLQIRRDLFEQIKAQALQIIGKEPKSLQKYREAYEKVFESKVAFANRDEFLLALRARDIIYVGDFHAVRQSQKALIRILETFPKQEKLVLAVEFLETHQQISINRYLKGDLSEKDLFKKLKWQEVWGFPWEHYRIILKWCQENKVPILALNMSLKNRSSSSLVARDKFSAQIIADYSKKNADRKIIVFYGDWHLAPQHLPKQVNLITKKLQPLFVFQNNEELYFDLMEGGQEDQVDLVRIGQEGYCLLNVPPWVKWQNYLVFLERTADRIIEGDDESLDYTDHVQKYFDFLLKEFSLPSSSGTFSVYTIEDATLWDLLKKNLKSSDVKWCEHLIETGTSFYLSQNQLAFLGKPSVNQAAGLAMLILINQLSGLTRILNQLPDDFERLIWFEALKFVGSKIVNPKRKSDSFFDLRSRLGSRNIDDNERDALKLALSQKTSELLLLSRGQKIKQLFKPRKKEIYQISARLLGSMMGEKIFNALQKGLLTPETFVALIKKPVQSEHFKNIYYEIIEMVESYPEPFKSKKEKL